MQPDSYLTLGVISGTSMDAIDLALIKSDGRAFIRPLAAASYPYPADLADELRKIVADARLWQGLVAQLALLPDFRSAPAARMRSQLFSLLSSEQNALLQDLEMQVTTAFCEAIERFLAENALKIEDIHLIGFHGQTIFHRPQVKFTYQLGDGAAAARRLKCPVVYNFRGEDVSLGGQGAPLVPLYHAGLAATLAQPIVVLNLGGVANVTYLDGDTLLAFDTGPASALIDDAMQKHFGLPYDEGGSMAASGRVEQALVADFMSHPFFAKQPPKSLDRNEFHDVMAQVAALLPPDQVATLTAMTIASLTAARQHFPRPAQRWLVTGGGRKNKKIMNDLQSLLKISVEPVEAVGWRGDSLEAECFGYLALRVALGLPLSLPTTTGVPFPLTGGEIAGKRIPA